MSNKLEQILINKYTFRQLWLGCLFCFTLSLGYGQQDTLELKNRSRIQVALLLDNSNSMEGLVNQARSQLWKMVDELSTAQKDSVAPLIEIALYEYGKGRLPAEDGFVRQVTPLTTDMDWVSKELFDLTISGSLEYCGWAIQSASEDLIWSTNPDDLKIIIIAGNEAFYQGDVPFRESCGKAGSKGIIVNTIFCGGYKKGIRELWKEGADIAKGNYMSINQEEKVYHYDTPFDEEIIALNEELNQTYLPYGPKGKENLERLKVQDKNALSFGNANMRTRIIIKTKDAYYHGSWDLVDIWQYDKSILKQVSSIDLPQVMTNMNTEQRAKHIEAITTKRNQIKNGIKSAAAQAKDYIREIKKESPDGQTLDVVLLEIVRKQAEEKGFTFPIE